MSVEAHDAEQCPGCGLEGRKVYIQKVLILLYVVWVCMHLSKYV